MKDGEPREQIELAVFSLISQGLDELATEADSEQISRLTLLVMLLS